jgi:uncharacterized membrane protein
MDRDERIPSTNDLDLAGEIAGERAGELDRLISLSDGVFAFAMTLLIVSVDIPVLTDDEARTRLVTEIRELWPQILSFIIGFLVIGFLWGSHRRTFSRVRDYDEQLIKLNIALLLLIAFLPFPTGVLGEYGDLPFPAIFYSVIIAAISVIFIAILDHLDRHRELLTRRGEGFDFPRVKVRHLVTALIFLLSIPVAYAFPGAGQLFWLVLIFNHHISERLLPRMPARFQERSQS